MRTNFEVPWTWEKESRGPKQKSLKKVSKKVSRGRAPKVRKKSRKRSEKSKKGLKMGFWRLFGPFSRLFSDFWGPAPGDFFRDFFETSGPETPSPRSTEPQHELFLHKLFEHPQGSGTSQQNSRDIPDSSLPNPRKTNFRGRARTFRPPPLRVEDPHPTRSSPDPNLKLNLCALFSFLMKEEPDLEQSDFHKLSKFVIESAETVPCVDVGLG